MVTDTEQHAEIRAGAAWALGEMRSTGALPALIRSFEELAPVIKIEAARALAKLAREHDGLLLDAFRGSTPDQRPGIAWALGKSGGFSSCDLLRGLVDDDARRWIAVIIGSQGADSMLPGIEQLVERDPEVYFAATVLWKLMASWTYGLEEY